MELQRDSLRVGTAVVAVAIFLRILGSSAFAPVLQSLLQPELASVFLFMETGRVVRLPEGEQAQPTDPTEPTPEFPVDPEPAKPVFSQSDAQIIKITGSTGLSPDMAALLTQPLDWDLTQNGPSVLIYHTHATESYENTEGYAASGNYRTQDIHYNMVSIGERVAALLEEKGIGVIHDKTLHDKTSYDGAYDAARESLNRYLKEYPTIRLVLDLHRDAYQDSAGNQMGYTVDTPGGKSALLMFLVGTNVSGQYHPNWQNNLSLGAKLYCQLESLQPGICRSVLLRTTRFNQDLCPGALLVEVGAAGNTRQEALLAAEYLAKAIINLAKGTSQ